MDEHQIIFKTLSGSKLYGTDSETSDTDIKGVFLPTMKELVLCKAPRHYTSTTGSVEGRNTSEDTDESYYSLHYFLELAAKGDTNAIDILLAYTNKKAVIKDTLIWNELIENIDKILTKNVKAYLGYCKAQCMKYSIKGDKLKNYQSFKRFCEDYLDVKSKHGAHETLFNCLNVEYDNYAYSSLMCKPRIPIPSERLRFTCSKESEYNFGDHCYFETTSNKQSYLIISDVKFQLKDSIKEAYSKVLRVISSYGKRAEAAANDNGIDWKAISHCVRVLLQVEELLTEGKITFPLKDAAFVKAIKYSTSDMTYDEVMTWIEDHIMHIDEVLLPKSTLREKADYKWIETFILKCYRL